MRPLYERFLVQNYRGFRSLEVRDLRRLNLIVGRNNTGKTALLEAMAMLLNSNSDWPPVVFRGGAATDRSHPFRELGSSSVWSRFAFAHRLGLIYGGIAQVDGELATYLTPLQVPDLVTWLGQHELLAGTVATSDASPTPAGTFLLGDRSIRTRGNLVSCFLHQGDDELARFEQSLLSADFEQRIESLLRSLDARVRTVRVLAPAGSRRQIYVDIGLPERLPLAMLGQGMQRLLSLATGAYQAEGGVLLIDEIEAGLHHAYYAELWSGIRTLATRLDLQVFATTHSYECLAAAVESAAAVEDLAVIRLTRDAADLSARTIFGDRLVNAVSQGAELR